MTAIQGGKFWSGFASGAVSSIAGSALERIGSSGQYSSGNYNVDGSCEVRNFGIDHKGLMVTGTLASGALSGGAAAALSKGNFWDGAVTGLFVAGFNHLGHAMLDDGDPPIKKKMSIKDYVRRYLSTVKKEFFGADIDLWSYDGTRNLTMFGTIHTAELHFYHYLKNGFNIQDNGLLHPSTMLLMHEYGHYLHASYDKLNFYSYAMWSSAATSNFSWAGTNWTEITANTYSYYYFGQPKGWDFVEYPINSNYLSPEIIQSLQNPK